MIPKQTIKNPNRCRSYSASVGTKSKNSQTIKTFKISTRRRSTTALDGNDIVVDFPIPPKHLQFDWGNAFANFCKKRMISIVNMEMDMFEGGLTESVSEQYDEDIESEIDNEQNQQQNGLINFCILWLTYVQDIGVAILYGVIPFYVLSDPKFRSWNASDLSLIYTMNNIGAIIGSQILSISLIFGNNAKKHRFFGHLSQLIGGIIAFILLCENLVEFNYWLFVIASFLIGYTGAYTINQCYVTEIDNGEKLLKYICQMFLTASVINQFMLPIIYEQLGFNVLCAGYLIVLCCSLAILMILHLQLKKVDKSRSENHIKRFARQQSLFYAVDQVKNSTNTSISIPIYVLLIFAFVVNLCYQIGLVSVPIVFAEDFNISASVTGYCGAIATAISFGCFIMNDTLSSKYTKWQYPYNIISVMVLIMIGWSSYIIFYKPWIVYSFFLLSLDETLLSIELTWRFELCAGPTNQLFQKITFISAFLASLALVAGSAAGPILFDTYHKSPFLVSCVLYIVLVIIMLNVYYRRKIFLNDIYDVNHVKNNYLAAENKFYFRSESDISSQDFDNESQTESEVEMPFLKNKTIFEKYNSRLF